MKAIINGKIVTPTNILEDCVLVIKDNIIETIINKNEFNQNDFKTIIDAKSRYIMPGFIDTHSDKIEQIIQPRPTSIMDFEIALKEVERQLINQGITTMYHSISLFKDDYFGVSHLRHKENVLKLSELINNIHKRNHLIHHRFHLRIEIDNLDAFDVAYNMILEKKVHQISFMDHTPGQGQYRNLEIYKKIITSYKGKDIQELGFDGVLERHKNKEFLSFEKLRELTLLALENGISVSSHDDDTIEKLNINKEIGVSVSEFPISIATAKEAKKLGFHTVAGAPNILLGGSHSGNMSAAEAICEDCIDILCSDYYPSAMLHSIFIMNQKYNIPIYDMVNKVSLNPAKAMKIDSQYGSLEKGKKADILIIDVLDGYPVITTVLIDGYVTSSLEYRV